QGLDRHVEKGMERTDAGVGDEDVHATERLDRPAHEGRRAVRQGYVGVDHDRLAAQGLDLGHDLGGDGVVAEGVDGDVRALARGLDRRRPADSPRCARDQDDLVFKQHGGSGVLRSVQDLGSQPRSALMALAASVTVLVSSVIRASDMYWAAEETLSAATIWPSTERIGAATQRIWSSFSSRSKA